MAFHGFPAEGLKFLEDLAHNNSRAWFEPRKKEYNRLVRDPAIALVEDLGAQLQNISPLIRYDTSTTGSGSLLRLHRDIRFSPDKSPYKTNIAMMFWEGMGKKMEHPAFGFQFEPDGGAGMAGVFSFSRSLLDVYRRAVMDEQLGSELVKAVEAVRSAGNGYSIHGEQYKRMPSGFSAEHPRAEWLRYGGLYAHCPRIPVDVMLTPDLVDVCYEHCGKMAPIQRWLVQLQELAGALR